MLGDRLRRLADAHVIGRRTGDRPGSETTYYLTERGLGLAPAIHALARWGMPSLTLADSASDGRESEVFDQTWAVPDARLIGDETYQWSVDGVEMELRVTGRQLQRTRGPARNPVATLTATTAVLAALAAGETTVAAARERGQLVLTGSAAAIRRMFIVTGLPAAPMAEEP